MKISTAERSAAEGVILSRLAMAHQTPIRVAKCKMRIIKDRFCRGDRIASVRASSVVLFYEPYVDVRL